MNSSFTTLLFRSNAGQAPEILIDLEQLRNVFAQRDETGVLLGCRYQIYNKLFERFIEELMTVKVKLKFFVAAHQTTDELNLFIPNMEDEYYRHIELMEYATTTSSKHFKRNITIPASMIYNLATLAKKICSSDAIHINYYGHVQEIGQYAKAHSGKVLAIISNDLHLMLLEGAHQFWYANHINFRTMSISLFCQNALSTSTGLSSKQLQLLSVLLGSPYVPSEITKPFLLRMDDTPAANTIIKLSKYVKQNSVESDFNLEQIARDVFPPGDSNSGIYAIENGLNVFNTQFSVSTPNDDPFNTFSKQRNPFIYQLISNNVYLLKDIAFVDYRMSRANNWFELTVTLLQKMMGILFKRNIIKPMDRKICMKIAHDEPYRVIKIPIIYPTGK